ncbi:MAG TPA: TonB-dependent receptor [Bacteroidales bacterium]|nr:TonB-dependent receptor [Bacteroidales bacterium]
MTSKYTVAIVFTIFALCFFSFSYGQQVKITVKDKDRHPLMGATVQLISVQDSLVYYSTTNQNGIAVFEKLPNTLYSAIISFIGYQTLEKTINVRIDAKNFDFRLEESAITLDEVTVSAKKPLITQEGDKMIIDPEPLAHISSNTLEILENTPGMYVDQDGGVFLNSATPAKIYINGREQKMSNQDISTILQSLPPGSVQRIEVMRTPSTKYDASSSGGIINIILKQGVKIGRFGSANARVSKGKYVNSSLGFTYNDGGDKSSFYVNANYNLRDKEELLNVNRLLGIDTILHQSAVTRKKSHQIYTGYGINFDLGEKTTISYDGRINYNLSESNTANTNYSAYKDNLSLFENNNQINNNSYFVNIQQDFGINFKIDTLGSEWDTKFGYNYSKTDANQDYVYNFIMPELYNITGDGTNIQDRDFISFQSDLTLKLPYKFDFETGLKLDIQRFTSNSDYFINYDNISITDPIRTNSFCYDENITAGYLQLSKTFFKDFVLKGGVRIEHTYMNGNQTLPSDTSFLINRADWFPYVYLSRKIVEMMGVRLDGYAIYRRTISRPGYDMLNPSINFVDQFMYESGNPALKPQFTDNFEFNVSFEDMPVFAIGRNYTTDIFSGVVYQNPDYPDIAVRTYDNLGHSKETYLRGIVGIPPGGKYFFALGAQYNINEYDGFYDGEPLQYKRGGWRLFTFHALKLFANTRLTFSGFLMINGQMEFYELKNFGGLNVGIRQTFFDDKLTIGIQARDILGTMLVGYEINQGSIHAWGDRYTDNRFIGINLRYSFGLNKRDEKKGMFNYEE